MMKRVTKLLFLSVLVFIIFMVAAPDSIVMAAKSPVLCYKTMNMLKGKVKDVKVLYLTKGATCDWSSGNTKVARVNNKGSITAVAKGTTKVYCQVTTPAKTYKLSVTVNVYNGAKEVAVLDKISVVTVGDTFDVHYKFVPENSDVAGFVSTDPKVAKVNSTGKVTALKPGIATIQLNTLGGVADYITVQVFDKDTKLLTTSDVASGTFTLSNGNYNNIVISKYAAGAKIKLDNIKVTGTLTLEAGMPYNVEITKSNISKLEFIKPLDIHNVVDGQTDPVVTIGDGSTVEQASIKAYAVLEQKGSGIIKNVIFAPELDGYVSTILSGYQGNITVDYSNDCMGRLAIDNCKLGTVEIKNGGYMFILTDDKLDASTVDTVNLHTSSIAAMDTDVTRLNVDEAIERPTFLVAGHIKTLIGHGNDLIFNMAEEGKVDELIDEKNTNGQYGTYNFLNDQGFADFAVTVNVGSNAVEGITCQMFDSLINQSWADKSKPIKDPSGKITVEYKDNSYYMYDFCGTNIKIDLYFDKKGFRLYGNENFKVTNIKVANQ